MSRPRENSLPWDFQVARLIYTGLYGCAALAYHAGRQLRRRVPSGAFAERRGKPAPTKLDALLWVHASSMGEVRVAASLIERLAAHQTQHGFIWSASTETGYQLARSLADDRTVVVRAPVDLRRAMRSFISLVRPQALILIETEWWPNQLCECYRSGVPVFVANGRVSVATAKRYNWLRRYLRPLLRRVERFYMRSAADAKRLLGLGVDPARVEVTGSLKNVATEGMLVMRDRMPPGPPVFVAGCTRPGEEEIVLAAFRLAREKISDLCLWLAPRHPDRFAEIAGLLEQSGISWKAYSSIQAEEHSSLTSVPVVLVDTMGALAKLYEYARVAFVGGSLRPFGGHNPVEPVLAGAPVLFGPHTEEQAEAASALLRAELAEEVRDEQSLADAVIRWCEPATDYNEWNRKRREFFLRSAATADHVAADIIARVRSYNSPTGVAEAS